MYAITIKNPGNNYSLGFEKVAKPTAKYDEVIIKVHAAGVNRADIFQAQNTYPAPEGAIVNIPGLEVAGEIIAIGKQVKNLKVKDRVFALIEGGGYAQYVVAKTGQTLHIPAGLSFVEAAGIAECFATVYANLFLDKPLVNKDDKLLIHGGSSGIGTSALTLCNTLGIKCYTSTGVNEKIAPLKKLGAIEVFNYNQPDFAQAVLKHGKYNAILDITGAKNFALNLKALDYGGTLAIIALLGGKTATINLASVLMKNLAIKGSTLRSKNKNYKARLMKKLQQELFPLMIKKDNPVLPIIDKIFPLQQAMQAHLYLKENRHIGKIILQVVE